MSLFLQRFSLDRLLLVGLFFLMLASGLYDELLRSDNNLPLPTLLAGARP